MDRTWRQPHPKRPAVRRGRGCRLRHRRRLRRPAGSDTVDGLLLAGGGTTSPPLRALLADVLRQPLDAVDVPGASARGAGLLGAIAAGLATFDDVKAAGTPAATRVAAPTARSVVLEPRRTRYRQVLGQLASPG